MASKRRDKKGRVLRTGESQRADGRYMYRYTDLAGNRCTVYSWRLVSTDAVPAGKTADEPLRESEKRIQEDQNDDIRYQEAASLTVNDLFQRFMFVRTDLKETTRCTYKQLYEKHIQPRLGDTLMKNVKATGIQRFYSDVVGMQTLNPSTVWKLHTILNQVFEIAVQDNLLKSNPTRPAAKLLKRIAQGEETKRHALTSDEQRRFIEYVGMSNRYRRLFGLFTVLLWTGMRIGEALGLRWCDVDFEKNVIHVTHTLLYKELESGKYEYRISTPKTKAGIRDIPMFKAVQTALERERDLEAWQGKDRFVVDGYTDFIFLNSSGKVYTPSFIFDTIQNIVYDYNKDELLRSQLNGCDPVYLPKFSAHILRHTFCTRLCEVEMNLKVIQDIMGHKNIRTTMDVYNEATAEIKQASFSKIEQKIPLLNAAVSS